jgi:hypothetical protein
VNLPHNRRSSCQVMRHALDPVVLISRLLRWVTLAALIMSPGCKQRIPEASTQIDSTRIVTPAETAQVASEPTGPSKPLAQWIAWIVADTGFGPIVFGMTPEQANTAVSGTLQLPEGMTAGACDYAFPRGVDSLAFMIEGRSVVRIDVERHDVRTARGARVGDSEARIQQLYAGRVRITPHPYTDGHYLTVMPPDTNARPFLYIFETDGKVVESFRAGALPQVQYIEGCS